MSDEVAPAPIETPHLTTERLVLRPFTPEDVAGVFAILSDPVVLQYWDSPPRTERIHAERFVERARTDAAAGAGVRVAIDRRDDGTFIGWCALPRVRPHFRSADFGYTFLEAAWGQGFATEAGHAFLEWAFEALDLNRVQAEVDTRNGASARVLEKLGFTCEGTLRQDCIVDGVVSDTWIYGLLRDDPAPWRGSVTN